MCTIYRHYTSYNVSHVLHGNLHKFASSVPVHMFCHRCGLCSSELISSSDLEDGIDSLMMVAFTKKMKYDKEFVVFIFHNVYV